MSAATTNVSIRVDKDIKSQADALFAEFGLNFTTEALKEIEEMEKNPSAYKSYKNVDEMMEELLK